MKNKKLNRIYATIIATIFSLTALMGFNAFAYDPDGNGIHDIYDVLFIGRFLSGSQNVSNLTALDYNHNGVITKSDYQKLADDIRNDHIDNTIPQGDDTSQPDYYNTLQSINYAVYNATTGFLIEGECYSMNCASTLNNGESTNNIIGDDERVVDFSKSGVVKIVVSSNNETHYGTGFIVGPHAIATAAHIVDDNRYRRAATIEHIYTFNSNGSQRTNTITPLRIHMPTLFNSSNPNEEYYDYALITVQEDLSNYPIFELGVYDSMLDKNVTATITGFPGLIRDNSTGEEVRVNNGTDLHAMYSSSGIVVSSNGYKIDHCIDSTNGNSGGPLYITEYYNNTVRYVVFGIHNLGMKNGEIYNHAVQINTDMIKFYNNNSHIPQSNGGNVTI